jgi:concentrative nucleoside transporter, CNT family
MFQSILGLAVLFFVAWLFSINRKRVPWRMIAAGLALQFAIAGLMLKVPVFSGLFMALNRLVLAMEAATRAGTSFVFGYLGGATLPFAELKPGNSYILAFQALPLVIVIAALAALLYYWRVLPWLVRGFSFILRKTMGIGGALGVGAGGTIFLA